MRTSIPAALAAFLLATPAFAEMQPAPAPAFTISGGAALVTDYRFRGVSQTDRHPAIQGTFTIAHESGLYATVWASSIDDYIANGSDAEIDLIAGFKKTTHGGTTFDMGVLYYYYPGNGGANTDFVEPYISIAHAFGPVTAKATVNYAPKQQALTVGNGKEDNLYLAGEFSAAIPKTPISLSAHIGHTFGPSYLVPSGKDYTDWSLGASVALKQLTIGVSYVDTDKDCFLKPGSARNQCGAGVVGSVGVSF